MNTSELTNALNRLTQIVEKMSPPIPAIPAIPAIPQIILSDDHNLLIKLDTKVDALKDDIKALNDGTSLKINDHETRIRDSEKSITKIMTYGSVGVIVIGLVEFVLLHFYK